VFENFEKGEKETVSAMAGLKTIAVELKNALMQGDLNRYAELLDENWRNQQRLHPSVTNDNINELFSIARREGARGGKALGAGGGGCLLFYCRADREPQVAKALAEAGAQIIRFQFVFDGLEGWKSTG
jgi:D-glycero-alpha-D-manno-heptose-7-phosphate kinase